MTAQRSSPQSGPSWRGALVIAAIVAAVLGGVAVFSGGGNALDDAAASVSEKSMRVRFDIQVLGAGDSVALSGTGDFSADGTRGVAEVTYSEGDGEPLVATTRLIGNDVWAATPRLDTLPPGKRWVHSTLEGKISPGEFARVLEDVGDVDDRGEVTVAGMRCTRYRGTIDVATLLEHAGRGAASRFGGVAREHYERMPAEACVMPDGTPKLLVIEDTAAEGGLRVEVEFVEFGVDVDVEPPPARRVVEASKLPEP